ncbi:MAG: alanine racemase C-terminal domain-containing protein [Candidatus Thiodiazotropha sp.]
MDLITLDARSYPQIRVGEEAILWGQGLPAEEVAEQAGTIPYELFCGVSSRVEFVDLNLDREEA